MNIDVIITDHHIPGDTIPQALAVLNPKQIDCLYPFKELCGCGVALKLMTDLTKKFNASFELIIDLLDLAALGTAADLVPMVDENRLIVSFGLETLKNTKRLGIRELLKVAGVDLDRNLNVSQVVFHVAPRINAAGRLGDANRVVELLTTTVYNTAAQLARELDEENKRRQTIQQEVIDEAILMVNSNVDLENDVAIILGSEGWHQGVVGIVASKLKEMYHRPSLIISFDKEGVGKGSARSINSLDLYKALDFTKHWLHNYGGHAMAAGLSLKKSNFNSFRKEFMEYAKSVLKTRDLEPVIILEGELLLLDINRRFMKFLEKLRPYGPGNMRPKFAVRSVDIVGNPRIIGNGDHIRFQVKQGHSTFPVIGFNLASKYENLIIGQPVDIACVVETNIWKGIESVQLNARDIQLLASANGRT